MWKCDQKNILIAKVDFDDVGVLDGDFVAVLNCAVEGDHQVTAFGVSDQDMTISPSRHKCHVSADL